MRCPGGCRIFFSYKSYNTFLYKSYTTYKCYNGVKLQKKYYFCRL